MSLFRLAGYSLLALAFFDYINIFVPLPFGSLNRELQMVVQLIELVPIPLLGFILVFQNSEKPRGLKEIYLLKIISWSSLIVGLLFLLLIPIIFTVNWLINNQNQLQINQRVQQTTSELQIFDKRISQVKKAEDFQNILRGLKNKGVSFEIINSEALEQTKSQISLEVTKAKTLVKKQAAQRAKQSRLIMFKNIIKYLVGAVVSGIFFIYCFFETVWVRKLKRWEDFLDDE